MSQLINLKCKKTCDIDTWCICEAVETIETNIENDIDDLSKKEVNDILKNDVAEVTISSQLLIPVDNFYDNPSTSRFSIIDGFEVVGGGIVNTDNYPNQRKQTNVNNCETCEECEKL